MEKIAEVLKTINTYFNILLTISIISLALLLSPKVDDYQSAIRELQVLKNISSKDYINHVNWLTAHDERFLPPGYNYADTTIFTKTIKSFYPAIKMIDVRPETTPDWKIYPIISNYKAPPIDSTLQGWNTWFHSKEPVTCYLPDWKRGAIRRTPPNFDNLTLMLRAFTVKERAPGTTGDYIFRAYFDTVTNQAAADARTRDSLRVDWWSEFDTVDMVYETFIDDHPVFQGYLLKGAEVNIKESSVNEWIPRSIYRDLLMVQSPAGERFLPALHDIWSEVQSRTINDALTYLENKKAESKKVTLLGIDFSFLFVLVIIPLAYFLLNIFLFLHLKYLEGLVQSIDEKMVFPWIGLYQFPLAKLITFLIFVITPIIICVGLIYRFGNLVGSAFKITSVILLAFAVVSGILIIIQSARIRKLERSKT